MSFARNGSVRPAYGRTFEQTSFYHRNFTRMQENITWNWCMEHPSKTMKENWDIHAGAKLHNLLFLVCQRKNDYD